MVRVLALYWSQTGQLQRALESLLSGLDSAEFDVHVEALRPQATYPFPWSFWSFLDVFPESVLRDPPELAAPSFDPDAHYDLIVLAYTVWFLAPALPVQAFLRSSYARVVHGRPVVTLVVCRGMWHTASEWVKRELHRLGAFVKDSVVVTDDGPTWATFVSTPRWMLTGRRDRFLRVFPPAGVSADTIAGLRRFGEALARGAPTLADRESAPPLAGLGAVEVEERFVLPELIGRATFPPWARFVRWAGPPGRSLRRLPLACFAAYLIFAILVLIPLGLLLRLILSPWVRAPLDAYVARLKSPSAGELGRA